MNTKAARFSPKVRGRAVRLVQECQADYESLWGTCESIAPKIGCSVGTLYGWVQRKEIDAGRRPGLTTDERERLKQLERENGELRRANDILKPSRFIHQSPEFLGFFHFQTSSILAHTGTVNIQFYTFSWERSVHIKHVAI